jgi:hypothetical protein
LVKSPIVSSTAFSLASGLLIERLSDISQVFKSQSRITLFGALNKLLRYIMIQPFLKPLFSTGEPSQRVRQNKTYLFFADEEDVDLTWIRESSHPMPKYSGIEWLRGDRHE